jgi:hypothetical protein
MLIVKSTGYYKLETHLIPKELNYKGANHKARWIQPKQISTFYSMYIPAFCTGCHLLTLDLPNDAMVF